MANSELSRRVDSTRPLVSVAVVTYNQKEFLVECIESILEQDYPNIEIVVADDGSKDGTAEFLESIEASGRGNFKILLAPQNRGITKNQNLALSGCTGKYISWMAGDDLMLPGKISTQVDFLERNLDYSICYHDLEVFESSTGKVLGRHSDVDKPRTGDVRTVVKYGCFNGAVSNMVRASDQPEWGFDERVPIASDWLYWVQCLWSGGKIGYIDQTLGRHRRHDANVTSSSFRSPSIKEIQDHLLSSDIVLSLDPGLLNEVKYRRSHLFKSLRWLDDGKFHSGYLKASLHNKFSLRIFVAYLASLLVGFKR